jgi:hypothetical protein
MKQQVRLTLDFTIESSTDGVESNDTETQEYIERQKRLYQAVIENPTVLEAFRRFLIAGWLGSSHHNMRPLLLPDFEQGGQDLADILAPAIRTLSDEDQQFLKETSAMNDLHGSMGGFYDFFGIDLSSWGCVEVMS